MAFEERDAAAYIEDETHAESSEEDLAQAESVPRGGVYGKLFDEGYAFDFYQAVRLLEKFFPDAPPPGETIDFREERIRFRPHSGLVFPAGDIKRIEWEPERDYEPSRANVIVTFMGLYGISSPLPYYFYDELANEGRDTQALQDFLDIFNHRLYSLFYRTWKKYRPRGHFKASGTDPHSKRFLGIAGVGTEATLDNAPLSNKLRLAAYAGRLSFHVRNVEGLRQLLLEELGEIGVEIKENEPRWVPLPERPKMGGKGGLKFALGPSATVGARVRDVSGKFRIALGPLSMELFQAFLPGEEMAKLLDYVVRLYVRDYLDYDVELLLDTSQIPPVQLGNPATRLGLTSWLGRPDEPIIPHVLEYA